MFSKMNEIDSACEDLWVNQDHIAPISRDFAYTYMASTGKWQLIVHALSVSAN